MSDKRATLEIIAPSIEEAVAKGLEDLGLPEDAVEVEVLDQGSRGLFGLGSRQARIRLTVKSASGEAGAPRAAAAPAATEAAPAEAVPVEPPAAAEPLQEAPVSPSVVEVSSRAERIAEAEKAPQPETARPAAKATSEGDEDFELMVARDTVNELVEKMKVRATVTSRYGEADEERTRVPILVEVSGDDLSILIGRRAETLNALQYISSLMVSKELGRPVSLVIDVEGYRNRREGQLRQIARRMADQAVKTGRKQVLEPMPANERRIIHIELRNHPQVTTESTGEEPRRKVTIIPKE